MDALGRYTVTEMTDRIYRLLRQKQSAVSTSGVESGTIVQGQAFSTVDVEQTLNTSLVKLYNKIIHNREEQFSQTFYVSTLAQNPGPYGFPPNMLILRFMDWIDPGVGFANARPEQWVPMNYVDDPMMRQMADNYRGPTWAYDNSGTAFILNTQSLAMANPSGVRIKAVVLPPQISSSPTGTNNYIQARFATVIQEAVIYEAAFVLASSRLKQVSDEIAEGRQEWWQILTTTSENAHKPPSTSMVSNRMPSMSFSGRRGGRRGGW